MLTTAAWSDSSPPAATTRWMWPERKLALALYCRNSNLHTPVLCMITFINIFSFYVMPLICMWLFALCMFFFKEVVKRFESRKAFYKFPIIIIIIDCADQWQHGLVDYSMDQLIVLTLRHGPSDCTDWLQQRLIDCTNWLQLGLSDYGLDWLIVLIGYSIDWSIVLTEYSIDWFIVLIDYSTDWSIVLTEYSTDWFIVLTDYSMDWFIVLIDYSIDWSIILIDWLHHDLNDCIDWLVFDWLHWLVDWLLVDCTDWLTGSRVWFQSRARSWAGVLVFSSLWLPWPWRPAR